MSRYNLTIPTFTRRDGSPAGGTTRWVSHIDSIPAGTTPARDDVLKYYGNEAPQKAFDPFEVDRLIFQDDAGSIVVVPDTPRNRKLLWLPKA